MPDTDEGHWKGEARPYFLNHVWNTVVRATPAMIQEVAGEAAPLVPAFNCADPHVAKGKRFSGECCSSLTKDQTLRVNKCKMLLLCAQP